MSGTRPAIVDEFTRTQRILETHQILVEDFAQLPRLNAAVGINANVNYELLGTNATSGTSCVFDPAGSGIKLLTAGADNDQAYIFPHQDTNQSAHASVPLNSSKQPAVAFPMKTGSSVTTCKLHAGLVLTSALDTTTDANQAKFTYDTDTHGNAYWRCNTAIADESGEGDGEFLTDVPVTADTEYYLMIFLNAERKAEFYINGEKVHTSEAMTANAALLPIFGVQALAGAARDVYLRKLIRARLH